MITGSKSAAGRPLGRPVFFASSFFGSIGAKRREQRGHRFRRFERLSLNWDRKPTERLTKRPQPMATSAVFRSLALALLLVAGLEGAGTEAFVVRSTPAADEVLQGPDLWISLQFSVRVYPRRSELTLMSPEANEIPVRIVAPISDTSDPLVLGGYATGLKPGSYRLQWRVLDLDGHLSQGEIPFQVK
jgi:methionine-rich copper-binding protein CopC